MLFLCSSTLILNWTLNVVARSSFFSLATGIERMCVAHVSVLVFAPPKFQERWSSEHRDTQLTIAVYQYQSKTKSSLVVFSFSISLRTHSLLLTSTLTRAPLPMSINPYSLSLERSLIIGREKWKHSRAGCQVSESASEHHFVAEWFKLGSIICQQVSHLVVVFQVEL